MHSITVILGVLFLLVTASAKLHPDVGLQIQQFMDKYNYPLEYHQVETEDGYLLTLHRIPYGRNETNGSSDRKPAVFMMHGLLSSSMDWINKGPDCALALRLADAGYDVWLGNIRGTRFSRNHTSLNPDNRNETFWDYSFHQVGYYDLPASIDHILGTTKNEQLTYVGFSEGTTVFFVMGATRSEYNDKVNLMVALAPVAYMEKVQGPLLKLAKTFELQLNLALEILGLKEILPYSEYISLFANYYCSEGSETLQICKDFIGLIVGFDEEELDVPFIPVITSNAPAGTSYRTLKHYLQLVNTTNFRQYDGGFVYNLQTYGAMVPPAYNLSLVTAPTALFYSSNDFFSSVPDVERLSKELPNVVECSLNECEKFSHTDFIWAIDINKYVNDHVVDIINLNCKNKK